jgi:hypothetical protein
MHSSITELSESIKILRASKSSGLRTRHRHDFQAIEKVHFEPA